MRYTGSKTISFTSSSSCKTISNFQGQAVFGRTNCQDIVTEDNELLLQLMAIRLYYKTIIPFALVVYG